MSEIKKINVNGALYDVTGGEVIANPELEGTEPDLTGLQVGDTKYAVAQGGSDNNFVVTFDGNNQQSKTNEEILTAFQSGKLVYFHGDNYSDMLRFAYFDNSEAQYIFNLMYNANNGNDNGIYWDNSTQKFIVQIMA